MEVFDAVRTALAVRSYQDRPIPDEVVHRIVEAGHLTASAANKQPWHFVVVQDRRNLQRIGELVPSGRYVAQAQLAMVVTIQKASPFGASDASRAVQSMVLSAWSDGVGSNWVGFRNLDEVGKLFAVPQDFEVLCIVPFGYPATPVGRGKKNRRPFGQVVSRERFGQPFE
jgi:nitroreductase